MLGHLANKLSLAKLVNSVIGTLCSRQSGPDSVTKAINHIPKKIPAKTWASVMRAQDSGGGIRTGPQGCDSYYKYLIISLHSDLIIFQTL